MKKNEKEIWEKLYFYSDYKKIIEGIDYGLTHHKKLYEYFPWLKILKRKNFRFKRSLEVGAGTGSYSLALKKLGFVEEVYLLDFSEESLKIAKSVFEKYGTKGNFVLGDALNLPFKDNFFDLTISGGLIEHFKEKDALKILKEKKRVSKYVLTQLPVSTFAYWLMRLIVTLRNFGWPFGYEKPVKIKKIEEMYKRKKIKIIDKEYHDVITATKFQFNAKFNKNLNLKKNFLNKLFMMEIILFGKK